MDELKEFTAAPGAQAADETRQRDDISAILIYTTFPSESEAKKLGRTLVESGLAACVNIFPQMVAIFAWEGKVEEAGEAAMIVKTVRTRAEEVLAEIKRLHPYAVPARLVLPLTGGGEDFLQWIAGQCAPGKMPMGAE
jgi:periplasmic divalent cation tolerance protein